MFIKWKKSINVCVSGKEEMIQRVNQMIKYKYLSQESKKVKRKKKMVNMEKYNNTRIVNDRKREKDRDRVRKKKRKKERKTDKQTKEI